MSDKQMRNLKKVSMRRSQARLSLDQALSHFSKPPSLKKHIRGASALDRDSCEPKTLKKNKHKGSRTGLGRSMCVTPLKQSIQATREPTPRISPLSGLKFYYQIGFGSLGRVWKVTDKSSGEAFALKEVPKSK